VLADLLDLVLPRSCAGCVAPGPALCPACAAGLAVPRRHRPDPCPQGLPAVVAAAPYAGPVRAVLLAHKEQGRRGLARPLGAALATAAAVLDLPPRSLLVPVPSSPEAVRARGHDHARRLAAATARALPGAQARPLLVGCRAVADQAGLDRAARAANLSGALRVRGRLAGLPVVVVDDVVTTGATLAEAARALRAAGADVRGCVVVAATQRRAVAATQRRTSQPDQGRPAPVGVGARSPLSRRTGPR
jgi:predicted amidophosphoribosyltransferase